MELITIVSGFVVLVLACSLWIWRKDGKSLRPFCDRIRHRIRSALRVVSRDDMKVTQDHLQYLEQQCETRLTRVEATTKFSNQLQYFSQEVHRRLTQLETSESRKMSSESGPCQRPRSIVRFGFRLTLGDALWAHLGNRKVEDIEDHLIDRVIQGPFCPVCLKWLVGRDRTKSSTEVPAQCRHCGFSWDPQGAVDLPISLGDLKRQVYDTLDQEYRAGGTIQPYE